MGRGLRVAIRLLAGVAGALLVLLALGAARLSKGPIRADYAIPLLEEAMGSAISSTVHIGHALITWRDWRQGLVLQMDDLSVRSSTPGAQATVGTMSVALSPPALTEGLIAVSVVIVDSAVVTLTRQPDDMWPGETSPTDRSSEGFQLSDLLGDLGASPQPHHPLAYFIEGQLQRSEIILRDPSAQKMWRLQLDQAQALRTANGIEASAHIVVADTEANGTKEDGAVNPRQSAPPSGVLDVSLTPDGNNGLSATASLESIRPSTFALIHPALSDLAAIDLPLTGVLHLSTGGDDTLAKLSANINGSAGSLVLSENLARSLGLDASAAQRVPVSSAKIAVSAQPTSGDGMLSEFALAFPTGTSVYLPQPLHHRLPLTRIEAAAQIVGGDLDISRLMLNLDGPQISMSGKLQRASAASSVRRPPVDASPTPDASQERRSGTFEIRASGLEINQLRRYWPPTLAPGGQQWCVQHLTAGTVTDMTAYAQVSALGSALQLDDIRGTFQASNAVVDYYPPLPAVRVDRATGNFDMRSLRIDVASGESGGLAVNRGRILFPDLNADIPSIDISVSVTGLVRDALTLLNSPPLGYLEHIGITPNQTSGEVTADVRLAFPLLDDLPMEKITITTTAQLSDIEVKLEGATLTSPDARIDVDGQGLRAMGPIVVGPLSGSLAWTESFAAGANPRMRANLTDASVNVVELRKMAHLNEADEMLQGGTAVGTLSASIADDGNETIRGAFNLSHTILALPPLGWSKADGVPGNLDFELSLSGQQIRAVPHISLLSRDLNLRLGAELDDDSNLVHLDLDHVISGRTHCSGTVSRLADNTWDITISGISADLAPYLAKQENASTTSSELPEFTLSADLDTVWFSADTPISRAMATVVHQNGKWKLVQLQGNLPDGSNLDASIAPDDQGIRTLTANASNAGSALKAFDLFSDVVGGSLTINGTFNDTLATRPLDGRLMMRDFHLVRMPLLARLLGVLALSGIGDALTGRGLAFSKFELPFEVRDGVIDVKNARAFGAALGITASGSIDRHASTISLSGELVPFYTLNSALGRLPLIGPAMTGGEKGGGVFSASYRVEGPLSDPGINVNPMTVLVPGILRSILETFSDWTGSGSSTDYGVDTDGPP